MLPWIVAPTSQEFSAVQKGLKKALANRRIQLAKCGIGEKNAAAFCQRLDSRQVSRLVLLGWGGSLVPDIPAGAVIVADTALKEGLLALTCQPLKINGSQTGPVLTSTKVLLTPEEKMAARFGNALAVEMEAYPLAAWATQKGIPFFHARIILDRLEESVPDLVSSLDKEGNLQWGSFIVNVTQKPALFTYLFQFSNRIRQLSPRLSQLAAECLDSIS